MTYGDAIASAAPSPLEGFDRRANADPPAAHEPALTSTSYSRPAPPAPRASPERIPRGRPGADPSRADVPSVFLELLVAIRRERHELTRDERDALRRCEEQMQSRAVVAGYLTGAGTNALLKTLPAFKTQPVGRYIAAVSFGVTGAFYGARSAARACLERIVQLENSKLGELATRAVRSSAPLDPMLAKAPKDLGPGRVPRGDADANVDAGNEVRGGFGAHVDADVDADGRKGAAETSTRAAVLRAAAEAEASRRVRTSRLPSRPSPPVVDLSEEPRASSTSSSTSASTSSSASSSASSSGDGFVGFDALAAAGMRGGDAWATVGHVSDTSNTGQGGGGGGGSGARGRDREGTRERRRAKWAERANRRVDGADALSPFLGEESRPTPDMFDASELAARRERQRAGRARPRATIRTEYGDVMDQ